VVSVLEELARVRGESTAELARATSANAAELFALGPPGSSPASSPSVP
jgi:Tat protein secretion system quality control protein TatD with DNase activity